jgi:hypothetical protein
LRKLYHISSNPLNKKDCGLVVGNITKGDGFGLIGDLVVGVAF